MLVGRLGNYPEKQSTTNGTEVAKFSVATDVGFGEKKKTSWFSCQAYGKMAETCNKYLAKGMLVFVEGHVEQYRPEPEKMYWNVQVTSMRMLEKKKREEENPDATVGF